MKLFTLLLSLLISLGTTACSNVSQSNSIVQTKTVIESTKPSEPTKVIESPKVEQAKKEETSQKPDNSVKESEFKKAIKKYADENFGVEGFKTSWYDSIKDYEIKITDKETIVKVITNTKTDNEKAKKLNQMVFGFVNDQTQKQFKANRSVVVTEDGKVLEDKANPIQ